MSASAVAAPAPTQVSRGASSHERAAIAALTVAALLLRLSSLSRSLFTDEVYSLALAQRSFGQMVTLFATEANGVLYSVLQWPLIRVFGTSEPLVRLPAVIAGTASVPAMWWAARQFASGRVALLAAGLLAINPMAVWYSQDARSYAFAVLASCLTFGALARAITATGERPDAGSRSGEHPGDASLVRGRPSGGRRAWVGFIAAMTALAYAELLAVPILLPAQALLARRGGREGLRRWLVSLLLVGLCCLPILVAAAISRGRRNPLYWLPKTSRGLVELGLQEFTGGFSGVSAVRWVTLAAGALLLATAAWHLRRPGAARARGPLAIAAAWGLLPGALLLAVSVVEPLFWPRYAIPALPGLCLLAALCVDRLLDSHRGVAVAAASLASIVLAAGLADVRQVSVLQEDWPPIAAWLRADRSTGEPTIVDNALVLPSLGYYDSAFATAGGDLVVQEWRDRPLPAGFLGYKDRSGYGTVPNGPPSAAAFSRLAAGYGGRVWMIVSEVDPALQADPRNGEAVAWARAHCQVQVRETRGAWALHATGCRAKAVARAAGPAATAR
jgi:mannosyltransferase